VRQRIIFVAGESDDESGTLPRTVPADVEHPGVIDEVSRLFPPVRCAHVARAIEDQDPVAGRFNGALDDGEVHDAVVVRVLLGDAIHL